MTEEVGKKVCEGTVADLMKDKTGKQTVITLTRKNAYRVKKIREQGTDDEAVLFHFRKRCTGMGSYVHTIEAADGETELHPSEFEKWEAVEFLYPGYLEDLLDTAYNAYRWSSFEPEARAETDIMQYEKQLVEDLKQIPKEKQNEYVSAYHSKFSALLGSLSRCASPMVTGPAKLCRNERHKQTGVYYNAFSEDLFVWNNDIENAEENIRMQIVKSSLNNLHSYIDETKVREKLKPYNVKYDFDFHTNEERPEDGIEEITFYLKDDEEKNSIKISRGEERIFIWCFFLTLFDTEGWQDEQTDYIFIDDPVSSLDDHNIFVTIFTLLELIDKYYGKKKIIITTHHIGFATILSDSLFKGEKSEKYKKKSKIQLLERTGNGYILVNPKNDVLLYHLRLLQILDGAVTKDELEIYHIALLRQVLENIASFLGTGQLKYVLDQIGITNADRVSTIVNALTHQKVYYPQMEAMVDDNKQIVREIYHALMAKYQFIIHPNK